MCGRYTLGVDTDAIFEAFDWLAHIDVDAFNSEGGEWARPRYNICPTQPAPIIGQRADAEPKLRWLRWGLIPFWAKSDKIGAKHINARLETVADKPAFRTPYTKRRCLIVADGWFEWRKDGDDKRPVHISLPERKLLTLAGVWDGWRPKGEDDAKPLYSFSILTTQAEGQLREVHHRMPVIVPAELRSRYLDPGLDPVAEDLRGQLLEAALPPLELTEVTKHVNNVRHDDPACLTPR